MKLSKYLSLLLSTIVIMYFFLIMIIYFATDYNLNYSTCLIWKVIIFGALIAHIILTFISGDRVVTWVAMISVLPFVCLIPIPSKFKYLIILLYMVVFLLNKRLTIKIIGSIFCLILCVGLSMHISLTDPNSWNSDFQ